MSTNNGRRAWRKWARTQRGAFGMGFKDPGFARRHPFRDEAKPIGMKKARPVPTAAKPFTPLSLVGMSNGTRKGLARVEFVAQTYGPTLLPLRNRAEAKALLLRWHLDLNLPGARKRYMLARAQVGSGERLRPCAGCVQCRAAPEWIVRAMAKRVGLRVQIRRLNSQVFVGEHIYLAQVHRRGPWNPVVAEGCSRGRAFLNLLDCILREGRDEFRFSECDGSGVLPAKPRTPRDPGVIPRIRPWSAR